MPENPDEIWTAFAVALGENLLKTRKRRRLTQDRVAAAAGISPFTYRKLEHGESNPGTPANPQLRTLAVLAEVLEVPMASLLPPMVEGLAPGRA